MACEDLAREALAPEGVLPLRVNEMTPSVIICAEGSRISIQWREQRPDQPDHDEYGRAEAMAAFLVEAANRHGTAYDAIGSGVKALEWEQPSWGSHLRAHTEIGTYRLKAGATTFFFRFEDTAQSPFFSTIDEAKAAAQADFERRVLSCLSTHTAAGAGPVGEAVGVVAFDPVYYDGRYPAGAPSPAIPAEEPGEVERLTRERDHWLRETRRVLKSGMEAMDQADAAEAALAETRERLEKEEKKVELLRQSLLRARKQRDIARAALTGDAQEAGE